MGLFEQFKETIFLKNTSTLELKYEALAKLAEEQPDNKDLIEEFNMVKAGLYGENKVSYQLEKSNLGLFVLRDINLEVDGLKAQIDYVVITKMYCYFIECKNLMGTITINEEGDFIREYTKDGKKVKKGIYSPLRQVEAQRDVYKKIWNVSLNKNKLINSILRYYNEDDFTRIHKVLVAVTNDETILKMKFAPADIKDKIVKSDRLIRKIELDISKSDKSEWSNASDMESWAYTFLNHNVEDKTDYYKFYKEKFAHKRRIPDKELTQKLKEFRIERAKEMNIELWYVFNNEELDRLVKYRPKTLAELKSMNIIKPVRANAHGEKIIEIIND